MKEITVRFRTDKLADLADTRGVEEISERALPRANESGDLFDRRFPCFAIRLTCVICGARSPHVR